MHLATPSFSSEAASRRLMETKMLDFLIETGRGLAKEFRNRRELRDLLERDDRILRDIGLTRADVESALSKPMGINARHEAVRMSRLAFYLDGERVWARR
jgi:uncharacterized protein YjiS (DUF1127 family)